MIINNNISAMNNLNQLSKAIFSANSSLEKVASGHRINRASDDAAGLAISEKMEAQIRGSNQAISNAQSGISAVQTAEGAMSSTGDMLQRMRELAVQSSNDILSSSEREMLQTEFDALSSEVNRISSQTEFNGQKLLDGSFTDKVFQTGANGEDNVSVSINEISSSSLGLDGVSILTSADANNAIGAIDEAIETLSSERSNLGAIQNQFGYTIDNLQTNSLNTSSAQSRIRDSITSKDITNYLTKSLLEEASFAMQAHANQKPQNILSLLR